MCHNIWTPLQNSDENPAPQEEDPLSPVMFWYVTLHLEGKVQPGLSATFQSKIQKGLGCMNSEWRWEKFEKNEVIEIDKG